MKLGKEYLLFAVSVGILTLCLMLLFSQTKMILNVYGTLNGMISHPSIQLKEEE